MRDWVVNFKEDKAVWDAFVLTSPQRSVFIYSNFLDSLGVCYDLVTCYEKEKIAAGAVLIYSSENNPIESQYPYTEYQGVILADNANQMEHSKLAYNLKIVSYFISRLAEYYNKICFVQSWRFGDLRPFLWYNYHNPIEEKFKVDLRYTGILDLTKYNNFDDYLLSVRAVRRQEYKKASKNIEIIFSDDERILDSLHDKTFQRQNIERSSLESSLVKSICKSAITFGYGKMSVALLGNMPISAVLFLYDDRSGYYLFGANDPLYRNSGSGTLLMMRMIKDAFNAGIKDIDFVGVSF